MNTKMIARTGILLAICIVFQLLKGISVYITGPAVNAVIVIAVLSTGLVSGLIISVIAPLVAFLVGATPILQLIPLMLPSAFNPWPKITSARLSSPGRFSGRLPLLITRSVLTYPQ